MRWSSTSSRRKPAPSTPTSSASLTRTSTDAASVDAEIGAEVRGERDERVGRAERADPGPAGRAIAPTEASARDPRQRGGGQAGGEAQGGHPPVVDDGRGDARV